MTLSERPLRKLSYHPATWSLAPVAPKETNEDVDVDAIECLFEVQNDHVDSSAPLESRYEPATVHRKPLPENRIARGI